MSSPQVRQQLSPEEIKAQRAAKAAEKQNRVALALEKKQKEAAAKSGGTAATATATAPAPTPSPSASQTPKVPKPNTAKQTSANNSSLNSPASTPSHQSSGAGAPVANLSLERQGSSQSHARERAGSGSGNMLSVNIKGADKGKGKDVKRHTPVMQFDDPKRVAIFDKKAIVQRTAVQKQVPLFSHLPQYERESNLSLKLKVGFSTEEIHPAILRLGLQYASGTISGGNSRCVAMLTAFKQFIADYTTPPAKVMRDDLLSKLKPLVRFLIDSRPQSISMGNAIRYLKMKISKITTAMTEAKAKESLINDINSFITERIEFADDVIATHGVSKINDGDVILTFATSHVVERIFAKAAESGKNFRLIIVDSRPKLEGKELLRRLVKCGVKCTYIMINALSYVMKEVNKVFLGAAACLSNGFVLSRVGTAVVAMMAHANKVPVLVCCETYKFAERVQLDSIGFNELGDPDELIITDPDGGCSTDSLVEWRDMPNIKLLNLVFDLTPVDFVSMVVCEFGLIPPTSVPVILREYSHGGDQESS